MFWYSIYTAQALSSNGFGFLKNAAKVDMQTEPAKYFSHISGTSGDHVQTATVVIPLASGDTIAVCAALATEYFTGHCQWGGCRLA